MQNIHASCVSWHGKGILFLGDSGMGKSDICLRMVMDKQAKLVADDRVNIFIKGNRLFAEAPDNLKGLIEVRGLGIVSFPAKKRCQISLVVRVVSKREDVERMPEKIFYEYEGIKIPQIALYPFDVSSVDKVLLGLSINKLKS